MQKLKFNNVGQNLKVNWSTFLIVVFSISFFILKPVMAHETQTDGPIGAILHVDPDDSPVAREPSTLFFEFTDMEEKLKLDNCKCEIVINRNNEEIFRQKFGAAQGTKGTSGVIELTFPESDIYKVVVTGIPKEPDLFKPFSLKYSLRVENAGIKTLNEVHEQHGNTWRDHASHYLPVTAVIALLSLSLFSIRKKNLAIIFLTAVLLSHFVPLKAVHASHDGSFDASAYECCLPTAVNLPEAACDKIFNEVVFTPYKVLKESGFEEAVPLASTRSPPLI